ncbi:MAG: hypothetical protein AB7Q97_07020 [Gammaproteobacteria bacterium]
MRAPRAAIATCLLTLSCVAAGGDRTTIIGTPTCAAWNQAHAGTKAAGSPALQQWLMGFVSGIAMAALSDFLAGAQRERLVRQASEFCKAHPRNDLADAGLAIVGDLRARER